MESLASTQQRKKTLQQWLQQDCGLGAFQLQALVPDASTRRYYRVRLSKISYVAMVADPKQDKCETFIAIANDLNKAGISAPQIFASDLTLGFMLLSDFGDDIFLRILTPENANQRYQAALTTLGKLQTISPSHYTLPNFDHHFLHQEWLWFKEWFLEKWLQLTEAIDDIAEHYARISQIIIEQPSVFMHRDYHSANLMWLPDKTIGVLDFQDAFWGPITYDCVSILRDCYIDWPNAQVLAWTEWFWSHLPLEQRRLISLSTFLRWFDFTSMQRHIKALLTFSRKYVRDLNAHYLQFMPRTLNYLLLTTSRYPETKDLHHYLQTVVQPNMHKALASCAV